LSAIPTISESFDVRFTPGAGHFQIKLLIQKQYFWLRKPLPLICREKNIYCLLQPVYCSLHLLQGALQHALQAALLVTPGRFTGCYLEPNPRDFSLVPPVPRLHLPYTSPADELPSPPRRARACRDKPTCQETRATFSARE